MERLRSAFWSGVAWMALLGMLSSIGGTALAGPIVKITEPNHGQVVQGQILITVAYRTDSNQPITSLELLVDGQVARNYTLSTPRLEGAQTFSWDFSSVAGSEHSIGARAIDAAGEVGAASIKVTVVGARTVSASGEDRVPPVINIYYPAQGARLSGEVEIKAEASDNVGVKYVFFYIDGKPHKLIMNAPPYVDRVDTTRMSDGPHVLQAKAMDEAENSGSSAEVTVFVQNHDMTTADESAIQGQSAADTPAPELAPQPGVTEMQFGAADESPEMVAALPPTEALSAEVGYVPAIGDETGTARTSVPRTTLTDGSHAARTADDANIDLTGLGQITVVDDTIAGPALAATDFTPRMTTPRTLKPMLEVKPNQDLAAAPAAPVRSLVPAEAMSAEEAGDASLLTQVQPGELVARVGVAETDMSQDITPRLTVPDRRPATTMEFAPVETDLMAEATRIAVLPETASRTVIPADGRVTRPDGSVIAPVASMNFEDVSVVFDNETLELLAAPELKQGISIAPLREIFEHSDGVLYWYPIEKRVTATRPGTQLQIQIGDPNVIVNDQTRTLEIAPYIKHGRTMVPLQFIADTLDVTVTFNPDTGQICLTSNEF